MLQLQRCWDTHEKETWGQNYDQDGWLLACTALSCITKGNYINNDDNPWTWPAWVSYYKNIPYFVHRCGDKLWNHQLAKFNGQLPLDKIVEKLYHRALGDEYDRLSSARKVETRHERIQRVRSQRLK